jgi:hypothetical protein
VSLSERVEQDPVKEPSEEEIEPSSDREVQEASEGKTQGEVGGV